MRRLFNSSSCLHALLTSLVAAMALWMVAADLQADAGPQEPDVLALGGSVTEIIYALGQGHRLLGRDTTSTWPEAALELPDVGYVRALSPEGVLSVKPGLILAEEGAGPPEAIDVLRAASVNYVVVPEDYSAAGIMTKIQTIGAALGVPERADQLAAEVEADLAAAEAAARNADGPVRKVMFILSTSGGRIMASGQGTAADNIIAMAGGQNALSGFEGYKQISNEAAIAAAPDVILMMDRGGDHATPEAELFGMPGLAPTPAAKAGALVRINGLLLLGFGPRTAEAVRRLSAGLAGS